MIKRSTRLALFASNHSAWRMPWRVVPTQVSGAALWFWALLPSRAHELLAPLGDVINPGHRIGPVEEMPTTVSVPGVAALCAQGFTPVEELTGRTTISAVWPDAHKRSVVETRPEWTDEQPDGRLWLVRSPWPALTVSEALSVVWIHVEREHTTYLDADDRSQLRIIEEVLQWPQSKARDQLTRASHYR